MKPEDVAASYDRLASHWDGDLFHRENGIAQHRRALAFLDHRGRAIDIGCGSSGRIVDLLLSEGFDTEALDISTEMLALARRRHPDLTFHHADICKWTPPGLYDFVSAWDSIWHVPMDEQEPVLRKLFNALSPGGICIFTSGGLDEPSDTDNPCMGEPMYTAAPGIPALLEAVSDCGCVCRHLEYDQFPEKHLYLIVQKQAHPSG
ncbi:methyltransferase type 11 [Haloferula helveola]|uniref:Methyltransferase type 11 n=1 Tax=Haloferula helveola TaxID=490095 RepID=A0ABM7REE8_9BACT|nr:methyltransferase type 11 [Haloferula helveola]